MAFNLFYSELDSSEIYPIFENEENNLKEPIQIQIVYPKSKEYNVLKTLISLGFYIRCINVRKCIRCDSPLSVKVHTVTSHITIRNMRQLDLFIDNIRLYTLEEILTEYKYRRYV